MRITPDNKFLDLPCAHVAIGIAYERRFHDPFPQQALSISCANGYCTLREADSAIRHLLPVRKKVYFKRNERMALSEFLGANEAHCVVCVLGHYIYAEGSTYWSFFDNEDDPVVCAWYIEKGEDHD